MHNIHDLGPDGLNGYVGRDRRSIYRTVEAIKIDATRGYYELVDPSGTIVPLYSSKGVDLIIHTYEGINEESPDNDTVDAITNMLRQICEYQTYALKQVARPCNQGWWYPLWTVIFMFGILFLFLICK